MDSILNFIGNILVWIAIYAFFKKRKNGSSFWYEYGVAVKNIIAFIKDLFGKTVKNSGENKTPEENGDLSMNQLAEYLNHQVNEMIQYKYPFNYGWRYKADNWRYVITHKKMVDVEILVTSRQTCDAAVLIKNGTVCDVVGQKLGREKPDIPVPAPAPAPTPEPKPETKPEPDSKPEPKPEAKPEPDSKPEPKTEDEKKIDQAENEKKAVGIAVNYIIDNMAMLNTMANDAVAEGKTSFIIKDLPGDELAWSKIVDELHDSNFINCKVIGDTIEVGVNLAAPADDGNYDFEKNETPEEDSEKSASDLVQDQEQIPAADEEEANIEIITGSEDFIIPDEPSDMPD